jgi:two-component system NtrC family sensor kinase
VRQPRADAFARLFEAVHEGVFIGVVARQDTGLGSTVAANPHLKRILGVDASAPDETVRPFSSSTIVDAGARAEFLACLERDGAVTDFPLKLQRVDGTTAWVEVTARAEKAAGALHVEALVRDVSERRRRDDESRDLSKQLLQAEKMAALGQTISGVAHELNNPLATILNWAERLAARPLDETSHRGAQVILNEAERAARIVRNLLTFARKRQSTRSLIDLNHVVRETLARRPREAQDERIEFRCTLADDVPRVLADDHQLQQVLFNLVSNAEQAIIEAHGGGRLTVQTRVDAVRRMAVLEVTDDGPGVPVEMRGKIFDPFFTTKEVGKGTGLGLTVAYALVEEHGGRIRLESPPEGGARFLVELPCTAEEAPQPAAALPTPPATDLRGTRLLLVEDEVALASAVAEALAEQGLLVDRAGDGEEALARVRQQSYDAIVCDLKMPRVDGMMLYRAIAATAPALARRVIFVTGDVAGTDAERFLAETGSRWLAKPFRLADLLRAVRETVG